MMAISRLNFFCQHTFPDKYLRYYNDLVMKTIIDLKFTLSYGGNMTTKPNTDLKTPFQIFLFTSFRPTFINNTI